VLLLDLCVRSGVPLLKFGRVFLTKVFSFEDLADLYALAVGEGDSPGPFDRFLE
jgi:hypothetical protein